MAPTRRSFLAQSAHLAALLAGLPGVARAQEEARRIHQATRNTLAGALGVRVRRWLGRPPVAKPYPGLERIALPAPPSRPARPLAEVLAPPHEERSFAEAEIDLDLLSRLLHSSNGVTGRGPGGIRLRAAPSAGALYAGEVYVVAERVRGLPPGVHAYQPLEDALVPLTSGRRLQAVAAALERPERARGAAAAVLLSNVFDRYRWRYANRGYRYALIDSGHIGENLRLTAASCGLVHRAPGRFIDDRLNELAGIDGREEAVCALHLLGVPAAPAPLDPSAAQALVERHVARPLRSTAGRGPTERYHEATGLVSAPDGTARQRGAAPAAAVERGEARRWSTLEPPPAVSVEEAIATRRSARRFRTDPIGLEALGFVLDAAGGHRASPSSADIELLVFVHRVRGLPAGLYRALPTRRELIALRTEDLSGALVEACLGQEKAGTAAVGIAMAADVEAAAARAGDRAYRDLLIESGAVGQRIYLAAEALGLAARNLAAYVDDRLNALSGLDDTGRVVVHLTMVGAGD